MMSREGFEPAAIGLDSTERQFFWLFIQ